MITRALDKGLGRDGVAFPALLALLFVVFLWLPALAAERSPKTDLKKEKPDVFEVPTTGKILDVQYRPEFEEWWVTCREGDNVTIYSYDKRYKRWNQVTFVPRGAERKTSKPGAKDGDKSASTEVTEDASAAAKSHEVPKAEDRKPDTRREMDRASKPDTKTWWDPLNLIKQGGEKLLQPFQ